MDMWFSWLEIFSIWLLSQALVHNIYDDSRKHTELSYAIIPTTFTFCLHVRHFLKILILLPTTVFIQDLIAIE